MKKLLAVVLLAAAMGSCNTPEPTTTTSTADTSSSTSGAAGMHTDSTRMSGDTGAMRSDSGTNAMPDTAR